MPNSYLKHYGVKGMRWGYRKPEEKVINVPSKKPEGWNDPPGVISNPERTVPTSVPRNRPIVGNTTITMLEHEGQTYIRSGLEYVKHSATGNIVVTGDINNMDPEYGKFEAANGDVLYKEKSNELFDRTTTRTITVNGRKTSRVTTQRKGLISQFIDAATKWVKSLFGG